MDNWFEFILERYNYWIAITLMMVGLYIVFARGNLVKKIVGLNLFQTSVFIFYISIGKIAGGTAPIYMGDELGYGEKHGEDAGEGALHETPEGAHDNSGVLDQNLDQAGDLHSKIENTFGDMPVNDLKAALKDMDPVTGTDAAPSLHDAPVDADKISNDALANLKLPESGGLEFAGEPLHGGEIANSLGDAVYGAGDIIYTNPLPHVLILTAIVVGVATTAVGLALVVRRFGLVRPDWSVVMPYMKFGLPLQVAGASSLIIRLGDRQVLGALRSETDTGVFSASSDLGMLILMVVYTLQPVLFPALAWLFNQGQKERAVWLFERTVTYFLFLTLPAVVFLAVASGSVLTLFTTADFAREGGALLTPLVAAGTVLFGLSSMARNLLGMVHRTTLAMGIWVGAAAVKVAVDQVNEGAIGRDDRSEEHTSELQSH